MHIHYYSRLAGHSGARKLYQYICKHMYWPCFVVNCYSTVWQCPTCATHRIQLRLHPQPLQLFPVPELLEAVTIDVLTELFKAAHNNHYMLIISDKFTKLAKSVPWKSISAYRVATSFVSEWVFNCGPPKELISVNGILSNAKFRRDVCRILNIKNFFTRIYHPQSDRQVVQYYHTPK